MRYHNRRYSDEEVEAARKLLYDDGLSFAEASEKAGMPESTLKTISHRKGWPPLRKQRQKGEKAADPVWGLRRTWDLGEPIKNTDCEVEAIRLHRKKDAEFSAMVVREAVRMGLMGVRQ